MRETTTTGTTITINGVEYVPAASREPSPVQIAVLDRSWVVVGHCSVADDMLTITDASVVRVWGTTKGLGEIASGGPTSQTVLDPCGTVRAPMGSLVMLIDCDSTRWEL